jgi:hypothetical protein
VTLAPGIHTIDADTYHRDEITDQPSLSASVAAILCQQSPAHARAAHPRLNPSFVQEETKKEWDIGTAAHSLLLEGTDLAYVVEGYDNWKTNAAKAEAAEARAQGKIPMLRPQWEAVSEMVEVARAKLAAHPDVPALTDGVAEQTLVWQEDGVSLRARLDWLLRETHATILDYKTARSADPRVFERQAVAQLGYDVKAAFYRRAVRAVTGVDAKFFWLVQEKVAPFELSVVTPGPDVLAIGEDKVEHAIRVWRRCVTTGEWPGYSSGVETAELPPWAEAQWLERREAA